MPKLWLDPPPYKPPSPRQRAALEAIYRRVDAALAPAAGVCRECGKCCHFTPDGIMLFASDLELSYLVAGRGPPETRPHLSDEPETDWSCPYREGNRCGARGERPLGCRTYFCNSDARALGEEVYAEAMHDLRLAATEEGASWWYSLAQAYLDVVEVK